MEEFWKIFLQLLPSIATGVGGYLIAIHRKRSKQERATAQIIKALGRKEIMDAYQAYIVEGRHMTVERFEQLTEIFEAYTDLGGNGTAKRMYEEIKAKRPWIVTD